MRFNKIGYNEGKGSTGIEYQVARGEAFDDYSITTAQEPHPDFKKSLEALRPVVLRISELNGVAKPEDLTVRSVSFSYHKNGSTGVIFTALRKMQKSKSPMLLNTPLKILEQGAEDNNPDDEGLSDFGVEQVEKLREEATKFLQGKRAQGNLFEGQSETDSRAEDGYQRHDGAGPSKAIRLWFVRKLDEPRVVADNNGKKGPVELHFAVDREGEEEPMGYYATEEEANAARDNINGVFSAKQSSSDSAETGGEQKTGDHDPKLEKEREHRRRQAAGSMKRGATVSADTEDKDDLPPL